MFDTLKKSGEFDKIYKSGQKWHTPNLVMFYYKNDCHKVGFTVSKKIGNAVLRNFAKRRMRALFQDECGRCVPGSYIFVAKNPITKTPYEKLKKEFHFGLKKLKVLK